MQRINKLGSREISSKTFKEMKIIIPMSGYGERFRKLGYKVPKPLIEIDGIHMIGHVIKLFPNEEDIIFICNEEHLKNTTYEMEKIIYKYCKNGKIISIKPHRYGPGHAVLQAKKEINLDEPVLINYCDFSCYWDWTKFKKFVKKEPFDGVIPAYKGFHPHSLGNTNYAYIKEKNGLISDIQEKKPFTKNRMEEYASSGTYYFSKGKILLDSINSMIREKYSINGEYYISLAYKNLLKNDKKVAVYPLQHFFQWGTPQDLEEYLFWSKTFNLILEKRKNLNNLESSLVIPMAGLGKRFSDAGYKETKPIIDVSGSSMVFQALNYLPDFTEKIFVIRKDMMNSKEIGLKLKDNYPTSKIKFINGKTEGQAITALLGCKEIKKNKLSLPITIAACDSGSIYDEIKFSELLNNKDIDIIVWSSKNHSNARRNPEMFGWIKSDENGLIQKISTKKPISNKLNEPIVIGTFTFKNFEIFENSSNAMIKRKGKINNEYFIDTCINDAIKLGYRCHIFEVQALISWGTPNDLKTFHYWQSTFHKWHYHKYRLENDRNIPTNSLSELKKSYSNFDINSP